MTSNKKIYFFFIIALGSGILSSLTNHHDEEDALCFLSVFLWDQSQQSILGFIKLLQRLLISDKPDSHYFHRKSFQVTDFVCMFCFWLGSIITFERNDWA